MKDFKLERSAWGDGYCYFSKEDSDLYDSVKDSDDEKDRIIKKMLLDKAKASHYEHCRSIK